MAQETIKTSVIIPIFNTENYLEECIESVLNQTQREIEIILVDDGSTDDSRRIIQRYEERHACVKAIYQENQKQGAARNAGLRAACGKYIYFLDSDDYISRSLFEECYQRAETECLDFVMFDAVSFIDGEGEELKEIAARELYNRGEIGIDESVYSGVEFWKSYFFHKGIYLNVYLLYIKADFLERNQLFFESGIYYEDNDWMLRMYLCAQKIAYMPRQLYYRRFRVGSTMTVVYNEIHFRSSIVESRKMLDMLLAERETFKRSMIFAMLDGMYGWVRKIFGFYREENHLEDIWSDALDFYKYLLKVYQEIPEKNKAIEALDMAIVIKEGLQGLDTEVDLPKIEPEEQKRQLLLKELQRYPLNKNGVKVGIYGTGLVCEKFLSIYRQLAGEFQAEIFFIDTYQQSGGCCYGYPLYNLKEVDDLEADCIIIMSNRYRKEMQNNIQAHLLKDTEILFVPELLKYFY